MQKSVSPVSETLVKINLFSLGINWILALFGNVEFMLVVKCVNKSYIAVVRSSQLGRKPNLALACLWKFHSYTAWSVLWWKEYTCVSYPDDRCFCCLLAGDIGERCLSYLSLSLPTCKINVLSYIISKPVLRLRCVCVKRTKDTPKSCHHPRD